MHPADIKAALQKRGTNQSKIAETMNVSRSTVTYVIQGRSKSGRVAQAISQATGIPVDRLWPGQYLYLAHKAHDRIAVALGLKEGEIVTDVAHALDRRYPADRRKAA